MQGHRSDPARLFVELNRSTNSSISISLLADLTEKPEHRPLTNVGGRGGWPKVLSAAAVVFGRDVCFAVTDKMAFF
jgi:hypothetical protein